MPSRVARCVRSILLISALFVLPDWTSLQFHRTVRNRTSPTQLSRAAEQPALVVARAAVVAWSARRLTRVIAPAAVVVVVVIVIIRRL